MQTEVAKEYKEIVEDALRLWGKWARRDGVNKLWFLNKAPHLVDHEKYHEGEHPLEMLVDAAVARLRRCHPVARDVLYLYYVYEEEDGSHLSWDDISKKLECSRPTVNLARAYAIGALTEPVLAFFEQGEHRVA